jgi:hypothetical protein
MTLLPAHWYRSVPLKIPTSNHHKSAAGQDVGVFMTSHHAGTIGQVDFAQFAIS